MEYDDFLNLFELKIKDEVQDKDFTDKLMELISSGKITKKTFLNLIDEGLLDE